MLTRGRLIVATRARVSDDAGMTLTELIVAMGLMIIASTLALYFFLGTSHEANRTIDEGLTSASARSAMNQITSVLRLADTPTAQPGYATARFTTVSPGEVAFYSNVSASSRAQSPQAQPPVRIPPDFIDIKLANGTLTEYVYAPTSTTYGSGYNYTTNYPSTPTNSIVLATKLTNTTVFTYCSDATDPSTSAGCTPTTTPTSVAFVQVTLSVAGLPGELTQTLQSGIAITGAVQ